MLFTKNLRQRQPLHWVFNVDWVAFCFAMFTKEEPSFCPDVIACSTCILNGSIALHASGFVWQNENKNERKCLFHMKMAYGLNVTSNRQLKTDEVCNYHGIYHRAHDIRKSKWSIKLCGKCYAVGPFILTIGINCMLDCKKWLLPQFYWVVKK